LTTLRDVRYGDMLYPGDKLVLAVRSGWSYWGRRQSSTCIYAECRCAV